MSSGFVHRLAIGLLFVGLGILLLLHQTGSIQVDIGDLFSDYWPLFPIYYFGMRLIFGSRSNESAGSLIWSLVGLFFGFYFLAVNMDWIDIGIGELFTYAIPVLLIVIGLSMIFKTKREHPPRPEGRTGSHAHYHGPETESAFRQHRPDAPSRDADKADTAAHAGMGASSSWKASDAASFGPAAMANTGKRPVHAHYQKSSLFGDHYIGGEESWTLEPINVSSLIGDTVIDLTNAVIPAGETRISVSMMIGDVDIWLPDDPGVDVSVVSSLFFGSGEVLDRRESGLLKSLEIKTPDYGSGYSQLRIHVSVFIGDLHIRRKPPTA